MATPLSPPPWCVAIFPIVLRHHRTTPARTPHRGQGRFLAGSRASVGGRQQTHAPPWEATARATVGGGGRLTRCRGRGRPPHASLSPVSPLPIQGTPYRAAFHCPRSTPSAATEMGASVCPRRAMVAIIFFFFAMLHRKNGGATLSRQLCYYRPIVALHFGRQRWYYL
jgi:hypothetical protein